MWVRLGTHPRNPKKRPPQWLEHDTVPRTPQDSWTHVDWICDGAV